MTELREYTKVGLQYVMPPGKIQDKLFTDFYKAHNGGWRPRGPGLIHSASFEAVSKALGNSKKDDQLVEYLILCQNTETLEKAWDNRDASEELWLAAALFLNPWTPAGLREVANAYVFDQADRLAELVEKCVHNFIFCRGSKTELWFLECPTEVKDFVYAAADSTGEYIPIYASNIFYYPDGEKLGDKYIGDSWTRSSDWNHSFVKNHEWCSKLADVTEGTSLVGFFNLNSSIPNMVAPYLLRGEEKYGLPRDLDPAVRSELGRELFNLVRAEEGAAVENDLAVWTYKGCLSEDASVVFDHFVSGANWYYIYMVVQGFLEVFSVDDVDMWEAFLELFLESRAEVPPADLAATLKAACA